MPKYLLTASDKTGVVSNKLFLTERQLNVELTKKWDTTFAEMMVKSNNEDFTLPCKFDIRDESTIVVNKL